MFCLRLPFDWKTPIGYPIAGLLDTFTIMVMAHVSVCAIGLFIGYFGLMMSLGQNIQRKFFDLSENYKFEKNDVEISNDIRDVIHFHSEIKQLRSISIVQLIKCVIIVGFVVDWPLISQI